MRPVAHRAVPGQRAAIATTLARAFQTEPAFSFIIPDPVRRAKGLPRAFPHFVQTDMAKGLVFATPDCEGVTMWRAPGNSADSLIDTIQSLPAMLTGLGSGLLRGERVARYIQKHLPRDPVWYLHFAACDPAHQGKGFGGAAIRAGLAHADAQGVEAYLETADPNNVGLYQSVGFRTVHEWVVPHGPHFWGMRRPVGGIA